MSQKIVTGPDIAQLNDSLYGNNGSDRRVRLVIVENETQRNWYETVEVVSVERADPYGKTFRIKAESLTEKGPINFIYDPRTQQGKVESRN